jgi:hypothetical protein
MKLRGCRKEEYKKRRRSPAYVSWSMAIQRCHNPKATQYRDYGGRGIKVCERWRGCFKNFIEDMGERPEGMTLDRIDFNGDYCKENCKWATDHEQNQNRRCCKPREYTQEDIDSIDEFGLPKCA